MISTHAQYKAHTKTHNAHANSIDTTASQHSQQTMCTTDHTPTDCRRNRPCAQQPGTPPGPVLRVRRAPCQPQHWSSRCRRAAAPRPLRGHPFGRQPPGDSPDSARPRCGHAARRQPRGAATAMPHVGHAPSPGGCLQRADSGDASGAQPRWLCHCRQELVGRLRFAGRRARAVVAAPTSSLRPCGKLARRQAPDPPRAKRGAEKCR
jgi:hypothetical protein